MWSSPRRRAHMVTADVSGNRRSYGKLARLGLVWGFLRIGGKSLLGIPTAVIANRYKAGESIEDLAGDYDSPHLEIEEAIRCELAA